MLMMTGVNGGRRVRLGTAEWVDPADITARYPYKEGKIWLGRSENEAAIGYTDDRHILQTVGGRGGKGASFITNNLVLWPGSAVILDPKGENATVTAQRRGAGSQWSVGMGQAVRILDPFNAAQVDERMRSRFNPLDALDPDDPETIDEVFRIADALVVMREEGDPFWDESAREKIRGLILHVLTAPEYEGERTLLTVRKLIASGDWKAVEALRRMGKRDDEIASPQALLWDAVRQNPAFGGLVSDIGTGFSSMLADSAKTFENVRQTARRHTEFMDSPGMQWMMSGSDFALSELKTRKEGMSLYLCLPSRFMNTHFRWLRMMIALTLSELEKVPGRPATGHPVLMMLDEFSVLKRMPVIENALDRIAGFGVKMCFILQSLSQLKDIYKDRWETFPANCGLKIFFNNEDHFTREYASKLIGDTETIRDVHSETDGQSGSEGRSWSDGENESISRGTSRGSTSGGSRSTSRTTGVSGGESHSQGASMGGSSGRSYSRGLFGYQETGASKGENWSISDTRTTNSGWSESETEGESTSWGESQSESTGESRGRSRTNGGSDTRGWSGTNGRSETVHRRGLITPDEIGRIFGTVTDRNDPRYPGFALVLMAGQQPAAVRRVNYYEDDYFVCCFDPHPDHDFRKPEFCAVTACELGPCVEFLQTSVFDVLRTDLLQLPEEVEGPPQVGIAQTELARGTRVERRNTILHMKVSGKKIAMVAPHKGMLTAVEQPGPMSDPEQAVFRIGYYRDQDSCDRQNSYRGLLADCLAYKDKLIKRGLLSAAACIPGALTVARSFYQLSLPASAPELLAMSLVPLAAVFGFLNIRVLLKCPRSILAMKHLPSR